MVWFFITVLISVCLVGPIKKSAMSDYGNLVTEASQNAASLTTTIDSVIKMLEALNNKMDSQGRQMGEMKSCLTSELNNIKQRMESLEKPAFEPDRTLVLTGLKPSAEISDADMVTNMISGTGVKCAIRNIKRLESRGRGPGIIKCEVESTEEKIELL